MTAALGLLAEHALHMGFVAVMMTVLCCIGVLRLFDLHMPPALAVGVLPFVNQFSCTARKSDAVSY